jgi:hypothetical protein
LYVYVPVLLLVLLVQEGVDVSREAAPPVLAAQVQPKRRGQEYHSGQESGKNRYALHYKHKAPFLYWLMLRALWRACNTELGE